MIYCFPSDIIDGMHCMSFYILIDIFIAHKIWHAFIVFTVERIFVERKSTTFRAKKYLAWDETNPEPAEYSTT